MTKPFFVGQRVIATSRDPETPQAMRRRPGVVRRVSGLGVLVGHNDGLEPAECSYKAEHVQAVGAVAPFGFPFA